MSWDIFVQDIPSSAKSPADIPDDFQPQPVGKRSDIIAKIQQVAPMADFSNPSWGTIDGPNFSIEVNLGEDEQVQSFAFHIRGGDDAAGVVSEILAHLGLRAFDTGSGDIFDPGSAVESLRRWRAYKDSIMGGNS